MKNEIVLASANKKKIAELKGLLQDFEVWSIADIGFSATIEEPFFTFRENALIKAKTIYDYCGKDVLADDSGISVAALNEAPGVLSARYAGADASDQGNLEKMLFEMRGQTDRRAWYTAVLCLIFKGEIHYFEGKCTGTIIQEPRGENGFGYDPIFVPDGYNQTFAELDPEIKKNISHRAKAMSQLLTFMNAQNG